MNINELRVEALRQLIGRTSLAEFAERYDLSASYLSQLLNGHRPLGERSAGSIEEKTGAPIGSIVSPSPDILNAPLTPASQCEIDIPQYDVKAAMGDGYIMPSDHVETVRHLRVSKEFLLQQGLTISKPENLCVITGYGESMHKTFNSGDPLIIDRGVCSVEMDGVYLISIDNHLMVKRLQIIAGGIRIISDHEAYPPQEVKGADLAALVIHARVLLAWRAHKL